MMDLYTYIYRRKDIFSGAEQLFCSPAVKAKTPLEEDYFLVVRTLTLG